jgi:CTD small phosphatase-like protein 2
MVFVKDLSRIGRPLNKTIIVDNVAENFSLQPDNGIFIKSWFDDMTDTALLELAPLLKCKLFDLLFYNFVPVEIVEKKVKDVREALRKFRDQMID